MKLSSLSSTQNVCSLEADGYGSQWSELWTTLNCAEMYAGDMPGHPSGVPCREGLSPRLSEPVPHPTG